MLSASKIAEAKKGFVYSLKEKSVHEHDDCIRMAYEWLDTQTKTKGTMKTTLPIKHIIEKWAGRYISTHDVEVAAHMHPAINRKYPYFNICRKLTLPSFSRLDGIGEANTQDYRNSLDPKTYSKSE